MGHKEVPVTQLRKMMLEELRRRNYSQTTVKGYLKIVAAFAKYFHGWPALSDVRGVQGGEPHSFRPGVVLGAPRRTKVF